MAASVSAEYALRAEVRETIALAQDNADDPSTIHSLGSPNGTLTATTTPPVTSVFADNVALVAGTLTLDLTALTSGNLSRDFTDLKVQLIALRCPTSNTLPILVQKGAANAYNLLGADNASAETIEVLPGDDILIKRYDTLEDVDATHKDVKFTGNGTETINVMLVAG